MDYTTINPNRVEQWRLRAVARKVCAGVVEAYLAAAGVAIGGSRPGA